VHEVVADADTWERFVRNIDAEEPAQRFPKQMVGQSKVARQPSKFRDQSNSPPSVQMAVSRATDHLAGRPFPVALDGAASLG
jgi:hypothetical protein